MEPPTSQAIHADSPEAASREKFHSAEMSQEGEQVAIDFQTIRDHERLFKPDLISRGVLTRNHESVMIRGPILWTKDGEVLEGASTRLSLEELCAQHRWKVVVRYGEHFAVVATCD